MATRFAENLNELLPDLLGQARKLLQGNFLNVVRAFDLIQQFGCHGKLVR